MYTWYILTYIYTYLGYIIAAKWLDPRPRRMHQSVSGIYLVWLYILYSTLLYSRAPYCTRDSEPCAKPARGNRGYRPMRLPNVVYSTLYIILTRLIILYFIVIYTQLDRFIDVYLLTHVCNRSRAKEAETEGRGVWPDLPVCLCTVWMYCILPPEYSMYVV